MTAQKSLYTLLIATCLFASTGSSTTAAVAPEAGVRLHTEANYGGRTLQFSLDTTHNTTLQIKDKNQISSLEVPTGYKVTLVDSDGMQLQSQTFEAGKYRTISEEMNNKADIVIVSRALSKATASGAISNYPSFPSAYV